MKIRKPIRYILFCLSAYLLLHLAVYALQEKFFFQEKTLHADHHFNFFRPAARLLTASQAPESKLDFEEHFFTMDNGDRINALYFKTTDSLKGDILYFHGNSGNLDRWGNYASDFVNRGYNILMIDYRGYGKSEGAPTEANLYEDGQKAYDWIRKKSEAKDLILYGRSLGTGVASHIAASNPAKMLILETPFNNMRDVAQSKVPFLFLNFPLRHRFPNDENLPKIDYPIHIFQGTKDQVVPCACAELLKPHLKASDHFYTIENGGHNDLIEFPEFTEALDRILE